MKNRNQRNKQEKKKKQLEGNKPCKRKEFFPFSKRNPAINFLRGIGKGIAR